jgi:hypothetical protein
MGTLPFEPVDLGIIVVLAGAARVFQRLIECREPFPDLSRVH